MTEAPGAAALAAQLFWGHRPIAGSVYIHHWNETGFALVTKGGWAGRK